jgi:penicillin-binding protein 1C
VRGAIAVILGIALLPAVAGYGVLELGSRLMGTPPLETAQKLSLTVLDRDGALLRAFTTADGSWRLPVEASAVDPRYLALLLAFEDKRFYSHRGVDPIAAVRAGLQLIGNGRVVSGASTLTMQVARLLDRDRGRSLSSKAHQAMRAWQLERTLSKEQILGLYLRLAPVGGNIEGVRAASLAYFGKEPAHLSLGEAALLVALPQSPETRRPDRFPDAARRARSRVLDRAVAAGILSAGEAIMAAREPRRRSFRRNPSIALPSARTSRRSSKGSPATMPARSASASRQRSSSRTTSRAKCSPMWARRTTSMTAASAPTT